MWHQVGLMLHRTVGECKASMTLRERNQWIHYAAMQKNEHEKQDYYLAQIAHQISLLPFMLGGTPKLKMKDFLIKFVPNEQKLVEQMTPEERAEYLREKGKESRSRWEAILSSTQTTKVPNKSKPKKDKIVSEAGNKNASKRSNGRTPRKSRR